MNQSCPISLKLTDSVVSRIATAIVIAIVLSFLLTHTESILLFLTLDFSIRVFGFKKFSPIYNIALMIQNLFSLKPKMVDEATKYFAMVVGYIFVIATTICAFLDFTLIATIIAGIYLFCALLDVIFDFCIACVLYPYVMRFIKVYKIAK